MEYIHANFDPARAIPVLFAALTFLTSVYLKWRNSGYRLVDRLEEFLKHQEKSLDVSRAAVGALVEVPSPNRPFDSPAFSAHRLGRAIRKMDWGFGLAAPNDLTGAVRISDDQAKLAMYQSEQHNKRQALAHLLLGARAASREISDINKRNAARSEALAHFDKALEINPGDSDALEYAGMMLLELANPAGALARFTQLVAFRQSEGGRGLARAFRLQATAYENLAIPMYGNANAALINALRHLPAVPALERALAHEQHGLVRIKMPALGVANRSLQNALRIYQSIRTTPGGKAGLDRVNAAMAELNRLQARDGTPEGPPPVAPPQAMREAVGMTSWFGVLTKPAKPNG